MEIPESQESKRTACGSCEHFRGHRSPTKIFCAKKVMHESEIGTKCSEVHFDAKFQDKACPLGLWGKGLPVREVKRPLAIVSMVDGRMISSHCIHYSSDFEKIPSPGKCELSLYPEITIAKCMKSCKNREERKVAND